MIINDLISFQPKANENKMKNKIENNKSSQSFNPANHGSDNLNTI